MTPVRTVISRSAIRPLAAAALALAACGNRAQRPAPASPSTVSPTPGGCRTDVRAGSCHVVDVTTANAAAPGRLTVRTAWRFETYPDAYSTSFEIAAADRDDAVAFVRGHADVPCTVSYLTAPCPPQVLQWTLAPPPFAPTGPSRWSCVAAADCIDSCMLGAVNGRWYARALPHGEACQDGCSSRGMGLPQCVAGACVAFSSRGERDEGCTHRDVDAGVP